MTREIAINGLKVFRRAFSGFEPNEEMFDMAIKALEQESILDKIRAEILEEHENAYAREDDDTAYGLSMALDILDKYMAESEAEDGKEKI